MFKGAYLGVFCRLLPGKFQLIGAKLQEKKVMCNYLKAKKEFNMHYYTLSLKSSQCS